MNNPSAFIRQQLVTLLNEVIAYDGVQVPCYEGQGEEVKYQILIEETSARKAGTKNSRAWQIEQVIEIVSEQPTNLRKHIDAIGESVMQLMNPGVNTQGLNGNATWQIGTIVEPSMNYLDEPSGEGTFINRLFLRYNFLIVLK